jgi:hypothetical protein
VNNQVNIVCTPKQRQELIDQRERLLAAKTQFQAPDVPTDAAKANPDIRASAHVARVEEASPARLLEPLGPNDDFGEAVDTGDADPEYRIGTHGWLT